jgi:hypothetical protein
MLLLKEKVKRYMYMSDPLLTAIHVRHRSPAIELNLT